MIDLPPYSETLRTLSLSELATERQDIADIVAGYGEDLAIIQAEIDRRFLPLGKLALDEAAKDYGTVTREVEGGFKIKAEIKQAVKWDSAALQNIASDMSWEKIQHWFKIVFTVPEAKFKAMEPGPFKQAIERARTTKPSPLTVTLIPPKAD